MKTITSKITKRIGAFFSFSILMVLPLFAQTELSGTISKDSTLDLSGSPYVITSYLTVESGFTLTIQPGVIIKFNDYSNLYVFGTLNAENVVFTSANENPQPGNWNQIQVGDSWNAGVVNLSSCQINYAQQFNVYNGTATLTNTDISNSGNHAVYLSGSNASLHMTGGTVSTTNANAMSYYEGIYADNGSNVILSGVHIQNFDNGILMNNDANVSIEDITINSCNYPITYNSASNMTVHGLNNLSGISSLGIRINFNYLNSEMSLPAINVPYVFPWFNIQEAGKLIIGGNNILKFNDGATLNVEGKLIANPAIGENIYFTSNRDDNWGGDTNKDGITTAPAPQNWNGIYFQDNSVDTACVLRRCLIRYAGANQMGGISTFSASPTIDLCELSNSYIGIYMQGTSNPVVTNNTIGSSQMTPLAMSFEANPTMSSNTLSFSDNAYDAIGIIGGEMTANGTLKVRDFTDVPNITYFLLSQITVPAGITLTINKGITIKSYSNYWYYHRIIVNGTLIADATADNMINFTSARDDNYGYPSDCNKDGTITSPTVGDWGGIIFNPGSTGTMNYCRIKYAKIADYSFSTCSITENINESAIAMIDANPTITNCEFKDLMFAISCYRSASPTLTNNSMVNIQYTPINISGPSNPTISGITFTNVGWRAMGLLGGNVCQNGTIKKRDVAGFTNITYVLLSDMTINSGTYVNVQPGVVIKANESNIYVDGGFKTDGTALLPVVFTSLKDDNVGNPSDTNGDGNATSPVPGDWGSIKFRSASDDAYCVINHTEIKYPGRTNEGGITFENASGKLKNSLIINSSNYGAYCNGNSTSTIDSVTIQNCKMDPIAMSLTSNPSFSHITFTSNYSQAIKIIEGTLSTIANLAPRNVAGITNIAYVVSNLTITSNAKLTIQPGVVVKFRTDNSCGWYQRGPNMIVYGNLIAKGTLTNNIYFTSFADDSKGGDSNNDGNTTTQNVGDWGWSDNCDNLRGGIKFINNSQVSDTINVLRNCEISYSDIAVRTDNSHITIDSCTIQQSNYGITIVGSSNPDVKNSKFYNLIGSPIQLSLFSNPTFANCTALNVGYMALSVLPETYSQNDTVPVRSFAGYDNITYYLEGTSTINSGTTITIPAGIVFKTLNNWLDFLVVNGKLNIQGTTDKPVVFTDLADDNFGNPFDTNQNGSATSPDGSSWNARKWVIFNDVSDDLSFIDNTIFKYGAMGISTLSASPIIKNTRFENLYYGVDMSGVSTPKIDNCVFNNLWYYPMQISLVSYPASSSGNLITGSTYKVIKVRDEVLTQDVMLPKRDFGGKKNIPYLFQNYTIGTGASLTISPGVICKFTREPGNSYFGMNVNKGLNAIGGSTPDSTIVFTSILDDFYGGDSNSDSTATKPDINNGQWRGISFKDQSLDPLCKMKNCIVRFAEMGADIYNASPTFVNCNFNNNVYGAAAWGSSNPSFANCDFSENKYYGLKNADKSFNINAKQCWWGSNAGPVLTDTEAESGEQQQVTSYVNYSPWKTTGAINPITGDVSLNGLVQAYDASLVLKNAVGLLTLSATQQQVADVSGTAGITAYDASLILQYVVGMDGAFPVNKVNKLGVELNNAILTVGNANVTNMGESVVLPLRVDNADGMTGADIQLRFNPKYLQAVAVENLLSSISMEFNIDNVNGLITIAMASGTSLNGNATLANLKFNVISEESVVANVSVDTFLANEQNLTFAAIPGSIDIVNNGTDLFVASQDKTQGMNSIYPNPLKDEARLIYQLDDSSKWVKIEIFNLLGQKIASLENKSQGKGTYSISISNKEYKLGSGTYVIQMQTANYTQSQLFQVSK